MSLTEAQRKMRAQVAAESKWSRASASDRAAQSEVMRLGWLRKLADKIDPDHVLPEEERMERAVQARRAEMRKLSLRSSRARQQRAGSQGADG